MRQWEKYLMKLKDQQTKVILKKITETSSNKFNLNFSKNLEIGMKFQKQASTKTNLFSHLKTNLKKN